MSIYEKNLIALDLIQSSLHEHLSKIPEEIDYEVFMKENAFDTLNLVNKKTNLPLYEGLAQDAVVKQASGFEAFKKYPYLYFFGIGNGVFLKYLLQNEQHKRIIIIEPDIQILYVVLNIIDFSEDIEVGRVLLILQNELTPPVSMSLFEEVGVHRYARVYDLHVMCEYYEENFFSIIQNTNRMLLESLNNSITMVGNDTIDALIGLKHHITNIPKVIQTPPIGSLVGNINTTNVAVLVSTGPSLSKQLPLLKSIAPYVRIFAVDASLPILAKEGIKPDVVTSIERVALSARFFEDTPKEAFKDVVFNLSSIQHTKVLNSIKDGTKIISLRPLGYILETGPELWGYVGVGMSSANMAYELIYHSHFKTCILIGQDLAYSEDGSSHAHGHIFGENDTQEQAGDGYTTAYGGQGQVKTTHIWNMMRSSIEREIIEVSKRMQTINATEGGARIFGSVEMSFSKAIKKYVNTKQEKKAIELKPFDDKLIKKLTIETEKNVDTMHEYIETLYTEVESLFLEVAKINEQVEIEEDISIEKFEKILNEIRDFRKHEDEELYDDVIWHIARSMMLVQELQIAPIELQVTNNDEEKKANLVDLLKAYKPWLFSLAGILDAMLKTIDYARARRLMDEVQEIGVYIEDKCIDTFTCNDLKPKKGRVFDVDMRGILYDVSDEFQDKIDSVVFKDISTDEKLLQSFVSVIRKDDAQYNELNFMCNIQTIDNKTTFEFTYMKDVASFILLQENLEDEKFVEFICNVAQKYPDLKFKLFYFYESQRQEAEKVFDCIENKEFIIPKGIEDIVNSSEIYIYNYLDKAPNSIVSEYYYKLIGLSQMRENLFLLGVTREYKDSEDISDLNVIVEAKIDFKESIMSEIIQVHEKINEFSFINSLSQPVDEEKIKDLYCPNSIGFLATKENIQDVEFVKYVKELMVRFPTVEFKGFCLNVDKSCMVSSFLQESNLKLLSVTNIDYIMKEIEIFLLNYNIYNPIERMMTPLFKRNQDIFISFFTSSHRNITIDMWEINNREILQKIIKNTNITEDSFFQYVNKQAKLYDIDNYKSIAYNDNFFNFFNIEFLGYILSSREFKNFYNTKFVSSS